MIQKIKLPKGFCFTCRQIREITDHCLTCGSEDVNKTQVVIDDDRKPVVDYIEGASSGK